MIQQTEAISSLMREAVELYRDDPIASDLLEGHARRLDDPLRIAVAGMVKAGKSTLINAMVGEEIAPTDAGECTSSVIWFRHGDHPRVTVHGVDGKVRSLPIHTADGHASYDLDGIRADVVERIVVEWPCEGLRELVLIDTPGIASLSGEISERSRRFFLSESGPSEADAVIYVLRRLHRSDLAFLESFHQSVGGHAGAVNTLAVLSRADEIGAGRIGSLVAARDIANRYRADKDLRALATGVVPVAGKLAQTARMLRPADVEALVGIASLERRTRERMLLSVDRFVHAPGVVGGSEEGRAGLIDRFGLFGIRLASVLIQSGFSDAASLSGELARRSGLNELLQLISVQFRMRAAELKTQAVVAGVEGLMRSRPIPGMGALSAAVERIGAESHELRELSLLATARTERVALSPELTAEMVRLVGGEGTSPAERLGLAPGATRAEERSRALEHVHSWRVRAEGPLVDRSTAQLCRVVVRSCEGILAQAEAESGAGPTAPLLLLPKPGTGTRKQA